MREQTKYEKLSATPWMRFKVPGSAALNAALLLKNERLWAEDECISKSNRIGRHSKGNLFDEDAPTVHTPRDTLRDAVFEMTRRVSSKVEPEVLQLKPFGWSNSNPTGACNATHTHPDAHWPGVYDVSQPEVDEGLSGTIEFLDPRLELPHWRTLEAGAFRSKKTLRPAPGELVIFPSYLLHWVIRTKATETGLRSPSMQRFCVRRNRSKSGFISDEPCVACSAAP